MTTTVNLSVAALTIDCGDPAALADFWRKALGRPEGNEFDLVRWQQPE